MAKAGENRESHAADQPAQGGDKKRLRYQEILTALRETGSIGVEELSARLNVSVVTIRRDLDDLEQQGLLNRTHGGAVAGHPLFYEHFKRDRSFMEQVSRLADEKRRIGRAAAEMIEPGETIAVTPGTTTAEIIRGLPLNANITLVTNTVNIAMELSKRKDVDVFVTGGHLRGDWFSLVGASAVQNLGNLLIHTLFVGADGLDAEWGASCHNAEEAEFNAALLRRARRRIGVVDHTKLGEVAGWRICETAALQAIITDTGATDEMIAPFEAKGIRVHRV
jgi:DeoR family transcriptional regulator, aga operon transcriptional repressor